jgi:hypothetical protein
LAGGNAGSLVDAARERLGEHRVILAQERFAWRAPSHGGSPALSSLAVRGERGILARAAHRQ